MILIKTYIFRAVIKCWSKLPVPSVKGCYGCYIDDATRFAAGPIKDMIEIQKMYEPIQHKLLHQLKDFNAGKELKEINETIVLAVAAVNSGVSVIRDSEKAMDELLKNTQELYEEGLVKLNNSYKENRLLDAKALITASEHKSILLNLAPAIYIKEQKKAYYISKMLLNATELLEQISFKTLKSKTKNILSSP